MKKLYVGNLPHSFNQEEFEAVFENFKDDAKNFNLIVDRDSGRSKGFGFVEFDDADKAEEAIEALNGQEAGGRKLVVNEARPKERREGGSGGNGGKRPFNRSSGPRFGGNRNRY